MTDDFRRKTNCIEELLKAVDSEDLSRVAKATQSWRDQGKPLPEDCWLFRKTSELDPYPNSSHPDKFI